MLAARLSFCLLTLAGAATAQVPDPAREFVLETYDPRLSWPLFASIDENGNDQLDLLEAGRGMPGLVVANEPTAFQLLDQDNDGFLQWLEFDQRYREAIRTSGKFTVKLARPLVTPFDPTDVVAATSHEAALLRLIDHDDDQRLSPREYREFLVAADLGATAPSFSDVDGDESGFLTLAEFAKILQLLPDSGASIIRRIEDRPETLPPEFREADANRDDNLDQGELTASLIAIDPSLHRWAERILEDADFSGNGRLGRSEIERATAASVPINTPR